MPDSFGSTRPAEIAAFIGKHYIYTYDNGWQYETYIKNERRLDYRVHSGIVGGRWVKDQEAHIVRLAEAVFRASWIEPTGTGVSLAINLVERRLHGTIFFPRWVIEAPQEIAIFQKSADRPDARLPRCRSDLSDRGGRFVRHDHLRRGSRP